MFAIPAMVQLNQRLQIKAEPISAKSAAIVEKVNFAQLSEMILVNSW